MVPIVSSECQNDRSLKNLVSCDPMCGAVTMKVRGGLGSAYITMNYKSQTDVVPYGAAAQTERKCYYVPAHAFIGTHYAGYRNYSPNPSLQLSVTSTAYSRLPQTTNKLELEHGI